MLFTSVVLNRAPARCCKTAGLKWNINTGETKNLAKMTNVLAALKKALPERTDKYNLVFQLEARLNPTNKDRIRGVFATKFIPLPYEKTATLHTTLRPTCGRRLCVYGPQRILPLKSPLLKPPTTTQTIYTNFFRFYAHTVAFMEKSVKTAGSQDFGAA